MGTWVLQLKLNPWKCVNSIYACQWLGRDSWLRQGKRGRVDFGSTCTTRSHPLFSSHTAYDTHKLMYCGLPGPWYPASILQHQVTKADLPGSQWATIQYVACGLWPVALMGQKLCRFMMKESFSRSLELRKLDILKFVLTTTGTWPSLISKALYFNPDRKGNTMRALHHHTQKLAAATVEYNY